MSNANLRQQCHTFFSSSAPRTAAQDFSAMAAWCEAHDIQHDSYGEGQLIQDFENKVAALLGFEAACFVITGTMAQTIALRVACQDKNNRLVALHPTAHILRHESSNYQLLDHFKVLQVGSPFRPWTADDLKAVPDRLGAALYELPMREIGGQLPAWEQLQALKEYCREKNIHLHMDGARLWEAAAGYGQPLASVAAGFDSAYVSLYKGLGGLGGAMLLGKRDFIGRAAEWMKRMGGNLYQRSPYVVAAAMQFDEKLARMPAYLQRTRELYQLLARYPHWQVNPRQPHCNMLHLYFPVEREAANAARDQLARERGVWLFGRASDAALPQQSYIEWYVGEALLALSDQQVIAALDQFQALLAPA
ncbi:threonine aldolase family protein [Collimonas pratensis]|uniref:Beta-eliminating lyase family protein n=1 Tax=Collimonas pratensis TaxID=279113 RepID=A0A127Q1A1_9BURK|nr:beta-eliminating lyase-related protein [Collimonas pratensis]AMP03811.1 beta-eliminating lyase family protein [Collimonas pratensis]